MATKREIFENILTNKFDVSKFVLFTKEMLTGVEIIAPEKFNKINDSTFYYYVENYSHVGTYTSDDGDRVAIFTVALKRGETVERARSMQRNFVKGLLTNNNVEGALVAFYTPEAPEKWRLSFVRIDYEFTKGKINEKLTPARRYSYLVGEKEPCHTAKKSLFPIFKSDEKLPSIDEIEKAFSVEKVTDEFFNLYKEKYIEIKEWLEQCPDFVEQSELCGFTSEQFSKKLLGQLVFLYFVQKKGWLGVGVWPAELSQKEYEKVYYTGSGVGRVIKKYLPQIYVKNGDVYKRNVKMLDKIPDDAETAIADHMVNQKNWGKGDKTFVRTLFNYYTKLGKNFFDDVLEPLFYNTLNKSRGEMAYCPEFHCRIPFLNGGLFEELKGYDWKNNDFNIPNELFSNQSEKGDEADGVLDIFDRYNFTMNEDEPMEREVAIDPEMMGKVFENLLDVKDRKSKGAFYTPREIVHYMCQETLINYLTNKLDIPEDDVKDLVLYGDLMRDEDTKKTKWIMGKNGKNIPVVDTEKDFYISENILSYKNNVNRIKEIDDLLKNVKVADLAVGSGAFPLGMLSEIVKVRNVLTEYMAIGMSSIEKLSFINYGRKIYQLKTETIKNCLFACDIDPSAIDIAKLRLWLSIVIEDFVGEQDRNDGVVLEDTKPKQLPNLDCNFICGNSLIDEFEGVELISSSDLLNNVEEDTQRNIFQDSIDPLISNLIELQDKLYFEKKHEEKENIKCQIEQIYNEIVLMQGIQNSPESNERYIKASQMDSKPFVLWQLYFPRVFRDNGGFDIVIGNPPYVKIQNIDTEEAKILKKNYKVATGKFDLYVLFVEKAFSLLKKGGICSYIHPHRFLNVGYGKGIRAYLEDKRGLKKFVQFGVDQVFDSATTYTGIFFYKENSEDVSFADAESKNLQSLVFTDISWNEICGKWIFDSGETSSIIKKINDCNIGLLDIFEGIYQGLITLGDDKFILQGEMKGEYFYGYSNEISQNIILEAGIMRPLLKGENIRRYLQPQSQIYVIYPHRLNSKGKTEPIDEETMQKEYPLAYEYLSNFREELTTKKVKYKTNPKYWYSLHRAREKRILDSKKIITPQLQNYPNFAYDKMGMYPDAGGYMLVIKQEYLDDILYYYGILNSSLFYHFIKMTSTAFNNNYYYFKTAYISPFRFPEKADESDVCKIKNLVKEILSTRESDINKDVSEQEKKIDKIVYRIYGISEDEQKEIEVKYNVK